MLLQNPTVYRSNLWIESILLKEVMKRGTDHIIVFVERNTFNVPFRTPAFAHEWIDVRETAPGHVVERLAQATIAICNKLPLRSEALSQLPKLRLIAVA